MRQHVTTVQLDPPALARHERRLERRAPAEAVVAAAGTTNARVLDWVTKSISPAVGEVTTPTAAPTTAVGAAAAAAAAPSRKQAQPRVKDRAVINPSQQRVKVTAVECVDATASQTPAVGKESTRSRERQAFQQSKRMTTHSGLASFGRSSAVHVSSSLSRGEAASTSTGRPPSRPQLDARTATAAAGTNGSHVVIGGGGGGAHAARQTPAVRDGSMTTRTVSLNLVARVPQTPSGSARGRVEDFTVVATNVVRLIEVQ
jgi:hypothetical protein